MLIEIRYHRQHALVFDRGNEGKKRRNGPKRDAMCGPVAFRTVGHHFWASGVAVRRYYGVRPLHHNLSVDRTRSKQLVG